MLYEGIFFDFICNLCYNINQMQYKKNADFIKKLVVLIFILFAVISCSNPNTEFFEEDLITLKEQTENLKVTVLWTDELEANRLLEKIESIQGIDKDLPGTTENIVFSKYEDNLYPVYPEVPGFSIINTSLLEPAALSVLNEFCNSIINKESVENLFCKDTLYSLVVFLYDLEENGNPEFSSYLIGEPYFNSRDDIQCPARIFYKKDEYAFDDLMGQYREKAMDILIYLRREENTWKIEQVAYEV